ncbi:hypothetical protein [Pedosphaera parvula]|uniref:Uncharacterized protein n=1 Tax=Pedosphaera parvula (strain Ellin514) TaxID=320771 RepID=B9XJJ8_PEDPL|nr:hypothetical protein [Pedosphaera parvula]EEF60059.1 hypothetical protein Cflav_PD3118 [Pedosphaera parvula Ellin514]
MPESKEDHNADHAWVVYINPFCVIQPDNEPEFRVPLEEINSNTYNHGKLCEIVTTLPLPQQDALSILVCFDGALAIPIIPAFKSVDKVLEHFNLILCSLLLGGITAEALDRRDIVWGKIHKECRLWPVDFGQSLSSHTHSKLRTRLASTIDTIILDNPNSIRISRFQEAYIQGSTTLAALSSLTPTFLLRGFTELRYHCWSDALANLWICVEQLTVILWERFFLNVPAFQPQELIKARQKSLGEDNRTWSTAVKHEILFQIKVITEEHFNGLIPARKARNDLVHQGKTPEPAIVRGLYAVVLGLIEKAASCEQLSIRKLEIRVEDRWEAREAAFPGKLTHLGWEKVSKRLRYKQLSDSSNMGLSKSSGGV